MIFSGKLLIDKSSIFKLINFMADKINFSTPVEELNQFFKNYTHE
jgi:hypothetical protein